MSQETINLIVTILSGLISGMVPILLAWSKIKQKLTIIAEKTSNLESHRERHEKRIDDVKKMVIDNKDLVTDFKNEIKDALHDFKIDIIKEINKTK